MVFNSLRCLAVHRIGQVLGIFTRLLFAPLEEKTIWIGKAVLLKYDDNINEGDGDDNDDKNDIDDGDEDGGGFADDNDDEKRRRLQ